MIFDKIVNDRKESFKIPNKVRRDLLTILYSDLGFIAKTKNIKTLNDSEVIGILKRYEKETLENIHNSKDANLLKVFKEELEIIKSYLPTQLSEDELLTTLVGYKKNGITTIGEMMKFLKNGYDGQYDSKTASILIRELLKNA